MSEGTFIEGLTKLVQAENPKAVYVDYMDVGHGSPIYLFYTPEPDRSKGHDNYFGYFQRPGKEGIDGRWDLFVTNGAKVREQRYSAIEYEPGKFICSLHRHDYVTSPNGVAMLDGGLDYIRCNPACPPTHYMRVVDGVKAYIPLSNMPDVGVASVGGVLVTA